MDGPDQKDLFIGSNVNFISKIEVLIVSIVLAIIIPNISHAKVYNLDGEECLQVNESHYTKGLGYVVRGSNICDTDIKFDFICDGRVRTNYVSRHQKNVPIINCKQDVSRIINIRRLGEP